MRLHYFILLVFAAFRANIGVALTTTNKLTNSDLEDLGRSPASITNGALANNFIRTNSPKDDDEERAFEKVAELITVKLAQMEQIRVWLKNGHSANDVFKLLKLDEVGSSLLTNPDLKTWRKFITQLTKEMPEETMITKLRDQYGEEALASLLQTAKTEEQTKKMATKLQNEQFKQWYSEGYWPGDVIPSIFNLRHEPSASKAHQKIRGEYSAYLNKFYRGWFNRDKKILIKDNNAQLKGWLQNGYGVDDVFLALNLGLREDNIFASSEFTMWTKFANAFEKKNTGTNAAAEMVMTLTRKYGDVELAKILRQVDKGSTSPIFKTLQQAQFDFWYKENMGPRYIVKTFFEQADETSIGKLGRVIMTQYRTYLNKNHPGWSETILRQ